ncbi:ABC transporter permease [Heyndrickxia sp. NPDC080065]|uniref:ABC transporter permease n=1 Tax=Heyndrickxia sp. NPDC080065 TaxID=3390568 RepID=UPI003CFD9E88
MLNLIKNEWIKIFKRPGSYVMIGLIILGIIGNGALTKYYESKMEHSSQSDWKTELSAEIKANEQDLKDMPKLAKKQFQQQIEIKKYRLEHNMGPSDKSTGYSFINDNKMLISFVGLFTIIVAAGIVASEFGWGTIKLLLIRPIKRSKILLSKYLTVVIFGVFMLGILFVSSALIGFLLFGTGDGSNNVHLAYTDGHVVEQNMIWYLIKTYLLSSIDVIMLTTMAFMISAVFRNSSLAIGISIFLLLMGGNITALIAVKYDWAKYILFANTDLTKYFDGIPVVEGMTLGFSIIMLLIYFIIFIALAFGVFTKRDVAA